MQTTNVLGLKKPEKNEFYHVEDFNNNSDTVDALFEKDANGSVMAKNAKTLDGHGAEYFASVEAVKKNTLWETLTSSFDLNNALGMYRQYRGAIVKTLLNLPPTTLLLENCEIAVDWLPFYSNTLYGIQNVIISNAESKEMWFRRKDENKWSAWERIFTTAGGRVENATFGEALRVKRTSAYDSVTTYENSDGVLGYIGMGNTKKPIYTDATKANTYELLHTGNFPVEEGTFNLTYGSVVLSGFKYIKMGKFVYLYGGCSTPSTFTVPSMKSLSGIPFTPYASAHSYVVMTNDTYSPSNDANKTHVFGIGSAGITLADETTFNVGEPITLTAMYVTA